MEPVSGVAGGDRTALLQLCEPAAASGEERGVTLRWNSCSSPSHSIPALLQRGHSHPNLLFTPLAALKCLALPIEYSDNSTSVIQPSPCTVSPVSLWLFVLPSFWKSDSSHSVFHQGRVHLNGQINTHWNICLGNGKKVGSAKLICLDVDREVHLGC